MKLLLLILITSITLVSGCTEIFSVSDSGESIPADVFQHYATVTHSVSTLWTKSVLIFETESRIEQGFHSSFPEEGTTSYIVSGTIKNTASTPLNSVTLTVTFKDDLGNSLKTYSQTQKDIYVGASRSFEFKMSESETYFDHITTYDLDIKSITISEN